MHTKSKSYPAALINEVLTRVSSGELSVNKARKLYNIGGKMTIYRWLTAANLTSPYQRTDIMSISKRKVTPRDSDKDLEIAYYKTILELAEAEYGIEFKKILASCHKKIIAK